MIIATLDIDKVLTISGDGCMFPPCLRIQNHTPHFTDEEVELGHTASLSIEHCLTWSLVPPNDAESVCVSIESFRNSGRISPEIEEQPITT